MTNTPQRISPFLIGWLTLPYGLAYGWTAMLPATLVLHGFYLVPATMLVAPAFNLFVWRILAAPLMDVTGSLRRWYAIGLMIAVGALLPFFRMPLKESASIWITTLLCVSQIGALLMLLAATGIMARQVVPKQFGQAAGWYQTGIAAGQGLVVAIWEQFKYTLNPEVPWMIEIGGILSGFIALYFISSTVPANREPVRETAVTGGRDAWAWLRSRTGIFTSLIAVSPIGVGAATIAWNIGSQQYALSDSIYHLVVGTLSTITSILGYLFAGWASDRYGRWRTWLWSGGLLAAMALLITFCPFVQSLFIAGMLGYTFLAGCCTVALWAILVRSAGPRFPITGITGLSLLIGLATHYMRSFEGNACDDYSFQWMLIFEAALSLLAIGLALLVKRRWKIT